MVYEIVKDLKRFKYLHFCTAPFRKVVCEEKEKSATSRKPSKDKSLPAPKKKTKTEVIPLGETRPGVQVSILGVDTTVGQYLALLLKQCPTIKKLVSNKYYNNKFSSI